MKNTKYVVGAVCALAVLGSSTYFMGQQSAGKMTSTPVATSVESKTNLADDALLALIKNDQAAFEKFVKAGGDIHSQLPLIDGKSLTVAQGMSYFERPGFMSYLQTQNKPFVQQTDKAEFDIMTLAIPKNNPEMFALLLKEKPALAKGYGKNQWTLLHMASSMCAHKLVPMIQGGTLAWNTKAADGSTPLTLAAQNDCLPVLGLWKDQRVDFNAKDGRGLSAMSILKKKKDAALMAFVQSFEVKRTIASVEPVEVNLYRKRMIPKDKMIDDSALVEPEVRPLEANETADFSEFAD